MKQFHIGHPGVKRAKSIDGSYADWHLMDRDIIELVGKCTQCQQAAKFNRKVPCVSWPQTKYPWSRIHVDFAGPINETTCLVVVH